MSFDKILFLFFTFFTFFLAKHYSLWFCKKAIGLQGLSFSLNPLAFLIKCFHLSLHCAFSHFEEMSAGFIHTTACPINNVPTIHDGTFQPNSFQISKCHTEFEVHYLCTLRDGKHLKEARFMGMLMHYILFCQVFKKLKKV